MSKIYPKIDLKFFFFFFFFNVTTYNQVYEYV